MTLEVALFLSGLICGKTGILIRLDDASKMKKILDKNELL